MFDISLLVRLFPFVLAFLIYGQTVKVMIRQSKKSMLVFIICEWKLQNTLWQEQERSQQIMHKNVTTYNSSGKDSYAKKT